MGSTSINDNFNTIEYVYVHKCYAFAGIPQVKEGITISNTSYEFHLHRCDIELICDFRWVLCIYSTFNDTLKIYISLF